MDPDSPLYSVDRPSPTQSNSERTAQARTAILDAVMTLLRRDGVARLSMDNVAREAGMSKGGLFHHFPSKEALLTALVDSISRRVLEVVEQKAALDPSPGALLRQISTAIFAAIPPFPDHLSPEELALLQMTSEESLCALLSSVIGSPEVTTSLRQALRKVADRLIAEPMGERQLQIWLSAEGLMFWQMMGVMAKDDPLTVAMVGQIRHSVAAVSRDLLQDGRS
jgi:AcrR family transcriptional regulator